MNSRERVKKAISHELPDKVPFDLGSTTVTGIHAIAYGNLKRAFKLQGGMTKVYEPFQMLAEVEDSVRKALGVDTFGIQPPYTPFGFKNEDWKTWKMPDGTEVLVSGHFTFDLDRDGSILLYPQGDRSVPPSGRMPKDGFYFDNVIRQPPLRERDLDPREWVEQTCFLYTDEDLRYLEKLAAWAYGETEYSLVGILPEGSLGDIAVVPGPHIKFPKGVRDPEEWYVSFVKRKNYLQDIFGYQTEQTLKNLKGFHDAVGGRIDILDVSEADFGTQEGPLLSPKLFRELFKPFFRQMNDWVHKNTSWKTFYHSCGSIAELLEDFIEMGADIINPLQYRAAGMDLEFLKKEYGDRIVFWGGAVEAQRILPFGSPEEVRDEVIKNLEILSQKGGYVFASIHNIQPDVPGQNLKAMIETFNEWRESGRFAG
jgi:hypothetical protein